MQNATLHIKVKPEIAQGLKDLSQKRQVSVGELVRQAVIASYQLDLGQALNVTQRQALEAYKGGYISLAKLASDMGKNIFDMRIWLNEHDIPQNNSFHENDVSNA